MRNNKYKITTWNKERKKKFFQMRRSGNSTQVDIATNVLNVSEKQERKKKKKLQTTKIARGRRSILTYLTAIEVYRDSPATRRRLLYRRETIISMESRGGERGASTRNREADARLCAMRRDGVLWQTLPQVNCTLVTGWTNAPACSLQVERNLSPLRSLSTLG